MTDTKEALESQYVNAELISNSESKKLVVVDEGSYEETQFGKRLTLNVDVDGKRKIWRPNKDSVANLNEGYGGTDTKTWVGKTVNLQIVRILGKDAVLATATRE